MTFIKPLDKDIYNFYEEAIGIKKIVLGLLQERYAGEFSNIYADLLGQSAEYKVTSLGQFMEILPSLERIQNLLRRAMDEATGKRQKLEYPLGKFLKEKYPEMTVQNLQDSPIQSLVLSEWEHELRRRYPEIEEAYKNLPKVQSALQEPLRILLKIRDWREQELAKLESSTKKVTVKAMTNDNTDFSDDFCKIWDWQTGKKEFNRIKRLTSIQEISWKGEKPYFIRGDEPKAAVSFLQYLHEHGHIKGLYLNQKSREVFAYKKLKKTFFRNETEKEWNHAGLKEAVTKIKKGKGDRKKIKVFEDLLNLKE